MEKNWRELEVTNLELMYVNMAHSFTCIKTVSFAMTAGAAIVLACSSTNNAERLETKWLLSQN